VFSNGTILLATNPDIPLLTGNKLTSNPNAGKLMASKRKE